MTKTSMEQERFLNPYNFVDVSGPTPRYHFITNEKFHSNSGYIDVEINTVTPLFIPAPGENEFINNGDHKEMKFFHHNGQPLIPSTSLKGWLRSTVETLSNSCFPHDYSGNTTLNKKRRVPYRYDIAGLIKKQGKSVCSDAKKLCPACNMFGGVNIEMRNKQDNDQATRIAIGGKISVSFGVFSKHDRIEFEKVTLKPLGEPHPSFFQFYILDNRKGSNGLGDSQDYNFSEAKLGRKVYLKHDPTQLNYKDTLKTKSNCTVQLLNPGAVFRFKIHYFNLSHYELGLLLNSLDIRYNGQRLDYQLGMGKSLGLGRIKIKGFQVTAIDRRKRYASLQDDGKSEMGTKDIAKYINIFQRIQAEFKENKFDPDLLNKKDIAGYEIKDVPGFSNLTYIKEFTMLKRINDGISPEFPIKYPAKKNKKQEMIGFKWFMDEKANKKQRLFKPGKLEPLDNWGQESKK